MIITGTGIAGMEKSYRTTFINSLPGFKNLQLLGTINEDGITNLGLFNSVFHVGANPPLLGMVLRPERAENDTLKNIRSTGEYTLNNVTAHHYQQAHQTSAHYPAGVSEFGACGFTEHYADGFRAPFVAESSIKIGLQLRDIIPVSINGTTIVIGEIIYLILDDEIVGADGFVNPEQANSVAVAGLDSYYITNSIGRLTYAKPGKHPQQISV